MNLDKKTFQEGLRNIAAKKMALVRAAKKKPAIKAAPAQITPAPKVNNEVLVKLNEILALLQQGKLGTTPVSFIVTERDQNGKIKSFKVEG